MDSGEHDRKEIPEKEKDRDRYHTVATMTKKVLDLIPNRIVNYSVSEEDCVSLCAALIRICPTVRNGIIRRCHRLRVCPLPGRSEVVLPLIGPDAKNDGD